MCGCDGVTYSNDCRRLGAGAQKAHDGECPESNICGGIAGIPCGEGEVCAPQEGDCDDADVLGECVSREGACVAIYDPVCGCDGVTYGNDCRRLRAGVQKDHDGACPDESNICGGIAGILCGEGEVCELPAGDCDGADALGECLPRPVICLAIYDPVCGCDGVTYGNDCQRLNAGAQKAHDGECPGGDQ